MLIDLTKCLLDKVWVGIEDKDSPLKVYYQKLKYEQVLKYCKHYKRIGHSLAQCKWADKKKQEQQNKENKYKMEDHPKETNNKTKTVRK